MATAPDHQANGARPDLAALAEAALLADLAVVVAVGFRLTPVPALGHIIAAIPMAVLAARRGIRALSIGGFVAIALTFLFAGLGQAGTALVSALWGGVTGVAFRDRRSTSWSVMASIAFGWTVVAALTLAWFSIFADLREVAFESARTQWRGVASLLRWAGVAPVADAGDDAVGWSITNWYVAVPAIQLLFSALLTIIVRRLAAPVLLRIDRSFGTPTAGDEGDSVLRPPTDGSDPAVIVQLRSAGVAGRMVPLDLDVRCGEVLLITGPNGAGKSTLLALLGGWTGASTGVVRADPTASEVAVIGQRPDAAVLGATVEADLGWGLGQERRTAAELVSVVEEFDLPALERETSGLSGGELQRLVVAGAVLQRASLVLSDESTAMIDAEGRHQVRRTLRELADRGAAVVHVSHLDDDRSIADRVVELGAARRGSAG